MIESLLMTAEIEAVELLSEITHPERDERDYINKGLISRIYGPYLDALIRHGIEKIKDGTNNPDITQRAICIAAGAYYWADQDYAKQNRVLNEEQLRRHQANVLNGTIALVPAETAVSNEASIRQVTTTDQFLSLQPSEVQAVLSALNYGAFFRPQTMASATRTLARSEIDELLSSLDSTQEAMPHLSVSNWAIGQTLAGIYQYVAQSNGLKLRHFDIGSGHGATIAAIFNCIGNLGIDRKPQMASTVFETTPEFYQELVEFADRPEGASLVGLENTSHNKNQAIQFRNLELLLLLGRMQQVL